MGGGTRGSSRAARGEGPGSRLMDFSLIRAPGTVSHLHSHSEGAGTAPFLATFLTGLGMVYAE